MKAIRTGTGHTGQVQASASNQHSIPGMWLFYLYFNTSCERNFTHNRGKKAWQKFVGFTSILSVSHVFLILNMRKRMDLRVKPEYAFGWSFWPPLRLVEEEVVRPTLWGYKVTFVGITGTSAQPTVRHPLNVDFPSFISDPVPSFISDPVTSLQDECLLRWVLNSHGSTKPGDSPCL